MTDEQKKAECERICGPNATRDTHKMAPEMCPVLRDVWKSESNLRPTEKEK